MLRPLHALFALVMLSAACRGPFPDPIIVPDDAGDPACFVPCFGGCCTLNEECAAGPAFRCCTRAPGVDLPDDRFADTDCDGIDGDRAQAVFVDAQHGDDAGNGSMEHPLRSLAVALEVGEKLRHRQILVAAGDLASPGTLVLPQSIGGGDYGIYGSYDSAFRRSEPIAHPVLHIQAGGVLAADLVAVAVTWDRVDVVADNAAGASLSSVAFTVWNSAAFFTLRHARLVAGDGAPGAMGAGAPDTRDGNPGVPPAGGCGCDLVGGCAPSCAGCAPPVATAGPACPYATAFAGGGGGDCKGGAGERGAGPLGGCGGGTCPGGVPSGGAGGDGGDGRAGTGGAAFGSLAGVVGYQNAGGADGGDGLGGSGGGGGSGTIYGTCNPMACMNLRMSSPGPAGGSGGCGGAHGTGGGGGGGSFGLVVGYARPRLEALTIVTGRGGDGGAGGRGGAGRSGGLGGLNGKASGGAGGRGGHGGGGGGGGGGPSLCVALGKSGVPLVEKLDCKAGPGGKGGAGGGGPVPGTQGADGVSGPGM